MFIYIYIICYITYIYIHIYVYTHEKYMPIKVNSETIILKSKIKCYSNLFKCMQNTKHFSTAREKS